ncbi:quinon protein alcohol dehydrogenase-like superfamily [Hygrophoropsis aurantiaca]|uniref:Quinon protein alcohol dehydrogenase-like superfamily n=1 Tax=Hygrophoropsis aurantiaca TaxID=72124 RepID=A0ACB8AEM4_9AGAM|nr:quinon protein alcohol dehydrogenase-like superfamily [Hygrophoropsis aurantiaca]
MSTSAFPDLEEGPPSHLPRKVFKGHTQVVWSVAYFRNSKRIASGSRDTTVRIWDAESGQQDGESMVHDRQVQSMAVSPDERKLVSGGNGQVYLWDLERRAMMWKTEEANGRRVAFSPDGQFIAASRDKEIVLLDVEFGKPTKERLRFGESVSCLSFSPDGTLLAVGSDELDGTVRVYDAVSGGTVVGPFNAHMDGVTSLVFTPRGQQFITSSRDGSIRVWDSTTRLEIGKPMLGHEIYIREIALSPDGQRVASGSPDRSVRVWDLNTRRQLGDALQGALRFYSVAWSPDGRSVAAGDVRGDLYLWDVAPLEVAIPAPVVTAGNAVLPITSRSRTSSLSSSLLDLPAGAPRQSKPNNRSHDDFFGSLFEPPEDSTTPGDVAEHHPAPASRFRPLLDRLWKQLSALVPGAHSKPRQGRDDPHEMHSIQPQPSPISTRPTHVPNMQPPPTNKHPRTPTSQAVKVSAGYGFNRTHAATSDEDDEVPCCDYICFYAPFVYPASYIYPPGYRPAWSDWNALTDGTSKVIVPNSINTIRR